MRPKGGETVDSDGRPVELLNGWRFLSKQFSGNAFSDLGANATTFFLASPTEYRSVLKMILLLFSLTVYAFGIGYLIVAFKPRKNHGILLIAILGKTACGVRWIHGFAYRHVSSLSCVNMTVNTCGKNLCPQSCASRLTSPCYVHVFPHASANYSRHNF